MKIEHCTQIFRPYDIWFLYDTATDKKRRLLLGTCPICKKDVVALVEERKSDGRIFVQKEIGQKALNLIDNAILKKDIVYAESDLKIKQGNGAPIGICYGDNKEIHNSKGKVIKIRVSRCDWYGQKEIIKEHAVL
ncbi:MAG: hypothetical protein LUE64_06020 [Candidatus Gastranaerophilales bacterium]|nr:hypothetical protein [Candidatus Gastranaerophilales bacterium]